MQSGFTWFPIRENLFLQSRAKGDRMSPADKQHAHEILAALAAGRVTHAYHPEAHWWGSHPWNMRQGHLEIAEVWRALRHALPDLERRDLIFVGGESLPSVKLRHRGAVQGRKYRRRGRRA